MWLKNPFRSRAWSLLEQQSETSASMFQTLRELHAETFQEMNRLHSKELERLENAHGRHLAYVIEENQKLRDDLDRVRLLLTPALQSVELAKERTEPPKPLDPGSLGTPWQRVQREHAQRQIAEENLERKRRDVSVPAAVEGDNNGSTREGRDEAPLS